MLLKIVSHNSAYTPITKVLIVEDHKTLREIFVEWINDDVSGVSILQAANSKEAITVLKDNPDIQMIIMDYKLNGDDKTGADLTRQILRDNKNLLVVANSNDHIFNQEMVEAGCQLVNQDKSPLQLLKVLSENNILLGNT